LKNIQVQNNLLKKEKETKTNQKIRFGTATSKPIYPLLINIYR
jgi:hypothetical protein